MTLQLRPAATVPALPADLEHFQRYIAALAAYVPSIQDTPLADRQMILHLLEEQISYLQARRRHLQASEVPDRPHAQHWCVLSFHLEALKNLLSAYTPPASSARSGEACSCDLAYHPALARPYAIDVYISLQPVP